MQDMLLNLVIGVVGSIIATLLLELFRGPAGLSSVPVSLGGNEDFQEPSDNDIRARNRQKAKSFFSNFVFFFVTFLLVHQALTLPVLWKVWRTGQDIYLSDARVIGTLLPKVLITKDVVQAGWLAVIIPIYIATLFVVRFLAHIVSIGVNIFVPITVNMWQRIQLLVFTVIAGCYAVLSIYAFYQVTLKEAASNFVGVLAIGFLFFMASNRR